MSFLARFSILTKIITVIALIGVITAGCAHYMIGKMSEIDAAYSGYLARDAQANVVASRANRAIYQIRYLAWRSIAEADNTSLRANEAEYIKTFEEFGQMLRFVRDNSPPAYGAQAERIAAKVATTFRGQLDIAMAHAVANRNAEALAQQIRNTPLFNEITRDLGELRDGLATAIQKGSEELAAATASTIRLSMIALGLGLALGIGAAVLVALFGIIRPIRNLVAALTRMAGGTLDIEIAESKRRDELGEVGRAVVAIKARAEEKALAEAAEKAKDDARAAAQRKADMQMLADSFETAVGGIIGAVSSSATELEAAAQTLTQTAETTQHLSTNVAAASEEASINVQAVASASEELASSLSEVGRQVQESSKIAVDAVRQAEKTDARITALQQAASRIGDVVKLITAVAEQTNLLALNATIEAARAGEAGRGFAVVAQEVKALAAQTAKATDEIAVQIDGMQVATQDSVSAIKEIGTTIGRISTISVSIAAAIEEQGVATEEIARNVQQAAAGTSQVAANITDVNRGATETGSASSQVLSSAQSLSSEGNRLKLEVGKFLETVRAA